MAGNEAGYMKDKAEYAFEKGKAKVAKAENKAQEKMETF